MKKLLCIIAVLSCIAVTAQEITGSWKGALAVQGVKLNLVFHINKTAAGYTATMDSPDQEVVGIPITTVSFADNNLILSIPAGQVEYVGTLQDGKITGVYKQGPSSWPLELTPGKYEKKRPQHPTGPFPYNEEEVTFTNKVENVQLAGTLTMPKKAGKYPVAILISGSGQQDRNSTVMGHKPFLVIADHLTRAGIAVLRFDDRGVGKSTGNPMLSTSADFAQDVQAAVQYLLGRKDIDKGKIGLIGHSEGGIIAPMIASGSSDIRFMVLLAAPGLPGDQLLLGQTEALAKAANNSEEDIRTMVEINGKIYDAVKKHTVAADLQRALKQIYDDQYNQIPENVRPSKADFDAAANQEMAPVQVPWFQYFIRYDPSIALKSVKCPVLVLNGDKDLQVPAGPNTTAIKAQLEKAGNRRVTVNVLPGLNHLFQESKTGAVEEYGELEQTFSPAVLELMTTWISNQVK